MLLFYRRYDGSAQPMIPGLLPTSSFMRMCACGLMMASFLHRLVQPAAADGPKPDVKLDLPCAYVRNATIFFPGHVGCLAAYSCTVAAR